MRRPTQLVLPPPEVLPVVGHIAHADHLPLINDASVALLQRHARSA
jgi:hypothetical protein